jgi:fructosamine-3-kinase
MFDSLLRNIFSLNGYSGKTSAMIAERLDGGSVNTSFRVNFGNGFTHMIKLHAAHDNKDFLEKEVRGLKLLKDTGVVNIPEIFQNGTYGDYQYLILEYVQPGEVTPSFWENLGRSVGRLHRIKKFVFGLDHDNYMGALSQSNAQGPDWIEFWRDKRLLPQIQIAKTKNTIPPQDLPKWNKLIENIAKFIEPHTPVLLHGDLWKGNFLVGSANKAYLIDPATYYGHPEVDLAMTKLFGGFDDRFYSAYMDENKIDPTWTERIDIYNLYPILIHHNIMKTGNYYKTAIDIVKKYIE